MWNSVKVVCLLVWIMEIEFTSYSSTLLPLQHLKDDPDCGKNVKNMAGEDLFSIVGDGVLLW